VIKEGDHLLIAGHHRSIQLAAHNLADHIAHRDETNAFQAPTDYGRWPPAVIEFAVPTCCCMLDL
jgi:hypothetical protein